MNLNQLKTGPRMALGFGLVMVLMAIVVGVAYQRLTSLEGHLHYLLELQRRAKLADDWQSMTHLNASRAIAMAKALAAKVDGRLSLATLCRRAASWKT